MKEPPLATGHPTDACCALTLPIMLFSRWQEEGREDTCSVSLKLGDLFLNRDRKKSLRLRLEKKNSGFS